MTPAGRLTKSAPMSSWPVWPRFDPGPESAGWRAGPRLFGADTSGC